MLGLYLGMADFDLGETLSEAYSSEVVASPTSDAPPLIAHLTPMDTHRSIPILTIYVALVNYSPLIK